MNELTNDVIRYYYFELKKPYVDVNSLLNYISSTYDISIDEIVFLLREFENKLNSINVIDYKKTLSNK